MLSSTTHSICVNMLFSHLPECSNLFDQCRVIAEAASPRFLTAQDRVHAQGSPYIYIWYLNSKDWLCERFLSKFSDFALPMTFHHFIHVSSCGYTKSPLGAQFHRNTVPLHTNNRFNFIYWLSVSLACQYLTCISSLFIIRIRVRIFIKFLFLIAYSPNCLLTLMHYYGLLIPSL
jgi:hypothetical protein